MPRVEFSPSALRQLDQLIERYELPEDTRTRVARVTAHLADFPESGAPLGGSWDGYRFVLGPWSWMLIVYESVREDLVAVVSIEDARRSDAATSAPERE